MKKIFKFIFSSVIVVSFAALVATPVFAMDLVEVYQQALRSDPTFQAANASFLSKRESIPIARASLLPQLSATGAVNQVHNNLEAPVVGDPRGRKLDYHSNTSAYSLSLTQPIFNFASWATLRGAKASVRQAESEFSSAAQDLMYRVATAYFAVLQSQDILRYTSEQKKAVGEQLRQQQQRYEVGLVPVTDVNEAQASYDAIIAQEIAAQNDLRDQQEKLQEITGIKYTESKTLKANLPLVNPEPENIEQWVETAEQQNYALLAARYAAIAAREGIATQAGGHFPVLNAVSNYGYTYDSNYNGSKDVGRQKGASVGLNLTVPIFSGGAVNARMQQAKYLYQQAIATQDKSHRSVVSETRQAYLGVVSGISKIQADRQMVKSKISALQSTKNAYAAGMRTMADLLQAETALYDAEKNYAKDQYAYIINTLLLKQKAGILSATDLWQINQWLERPKLIKVAKAIAVVQPKKTIVRVIPATHKRQQKESNRAFKPVSVLDKSMQKVVIKIRFVLNSD